MQKPGRRETARDLQNNSCPIFCVARVCCRPAGLNFLVLLKQLGHLATTCLKGTKRSSMSQSFAQDIGMHTCRPTGLRNQKLYACTLGTAAVNEDALTGLICPTGLNSYGLVRSSILWNRPWCCLVGPSQTCWLCKHRIQILQRLIVCAWVRKDT